QTSQNSSKPPSSDPLQARPRQTKWLWISLTPLVSVFRLLKTRGAAGAKEGLSTDAWGIIGTDHYAAINGLIPANAKPAVRISSGSLSRGASIQTRPRGLG